MGLLDGVLGAITGGLTGGPIGAAVGGIGGLTSSKKSSSRTSRDAAAAQQAQSQLSGVGQQLLQRYNGATPQEQAILSYFFNRAGLGAGGNAPGGQGVGLGGAGSVFGQQYGAPLGQRSDLNGGQPFAAWGSRKSMPGVTLTPQGGAPGLVNGNLGIYDSPQYQLLRQAAQEDINRNAVNLGREYGNSLQGRGLQNSSLMTGGQAAIAGGAQKSYSDFVRNLALSAADKQDQLAGQALGSLQGALGSGAQAGGLFAGAAGLGQAGQQLNQGQSNLQNSALGSAIGNAANYWALQGQGGAGSSVGDTSGVNQSPGFIPSDTSWMRAGGGPVQAGHPYLTGELGPELVVPQEPGYVIPHRVLMALLAGSPNGMAGSLTPHTQVDASTDLPPDVQRQLPYFMRTGPWHQDAPNAPLPEAVQRQSLPWFLQQINGPSPEYLQQLNERLGATAPQLTMPGAPAGSSPLRSQIADYFAQPTRGGAGGGSTGMPNWFLSYMGR